MSKKSSKNKQGIEIPSFIIKTGKVLQSISTSLTIRFAAKLFTTPIKYKVPKRERPMLDESSQENVFIESLNKTVVVYRYGKGDKKILLVHGWSGRGTQLYKIADAMVAKGYEVISFDAPGHGKSKGNKSMMLEFIECILTLEKKYGSFDYAIGHSLGGMAIINALRKGFQTKKIVTIGSGDKISDIIIDFIKQLQLKPTFASKLTAYFEKKLNDKMSDYDTSYVIQNFDIPHLIIHDKDDVEVGVYCAENIHKYSKNSTLYLTEELGHRKILGSDEVINQINQFID
ncbi:alpha/beta hydrolase [uncultured Flavobacterium sp.]|uniref:alpha/beta fold hydrolase n=1 Tax=uncultured Flavobacterium sp. TaxID=165435 RepID=UPI0030ED3034|tara:strand:- start:25775 stop:26635 length:861 start_codon:yes stop_codon:yes gene_type:complete